MAYSPLSAFRFARIVKNTTPLKLVCMVQRFFGTVEILFQSGMNEARLYTIQLYTVKQSFAWFYPE
jgi:hypothetical protein